jgi:predicted signal transduction protein with EAL and GGDEF domain
MLATCRVQFDHRDEALYAAKRNGRNRVEVFETEYVALSTGSFRLR